MATTRPRHTITETDDIAAALDAAARRWPGYARAQLLRRLVDVGYRALEEDQGSRRAARREAIQQTSGLLTGVYRTDELARLREDWPE